MLLNNLKPWQRILIFIIIPVLVIVIFLYGYAFLYDYYYSQNFPQISLVASEQGFNPTEFIDSSVSFVVELANALVEAVS